MGTYADRQFSDKASLIKASVLSFLAASLIVGCGSTSGLQAPPAGGLTVSPIATPLSTPTPVATLSPTATPTVSPTATPTPTPTPAPLSLSPLGGALRTGNVGMTYGSYVGTVCAGNDPVHCQNVYGVPIHVSGGKFPYPVSWAPAIGSALPPGLDIKSWPIRYSSYIVISGTPTTAGTYSVIV